MCLDTKINIYIKIFNLQGMNLLALFNLLYNVINNVFFKLYKY